MTRLRARSGATGSHHRACSGGRVRRRWGTGAVELVVETVGRGCGVAPAGDPGVRWLPGCPVRSARGECARRRPALIRGAGRASPVGSVLGEHVPGVIQPRREITVDGLFLNQTVLDVAVVRLERRHLRAELLVLELEVAEAGLERPDRRVAREDRIGLGAAGEQARDGQQHEGSGINAGQHGEDPAISEQLESEGLVRHFEFDRLDRARLKTNATRRNPRSS